MKSIAVIALAALICLIGESVALKVSHQSSAAVKASHQSASAVKESHKSALASIVSNKKKSASLRTAEKLLANLREKVKREFIEYKEIYYEQVRHCANRYKSCRFMIKGTGLTVKEDEAVILEIVAIDENIAIRITELINEIATKTGELKEARELRYNQSVDYEKSDKELADMLKMLQLAIDQLKVSATTIEGDQYALVQVKNAKATLQAFKAMVQASSVNFAGSEKLASLLQSADADEDDDEQFPGAPSSTAYASRVGGALQTLEELWETTYQAREKGQRTEISRVSTFEKMEFNVNKMLKFAKANLKKKQDELAELERRKAQAQADYEAALKALEWQYDGMNMTEQECMDAAAAYEQYELNYRAELKALNTVIELIDKTTKNVGSIAITFLQEQQQRQSGGLELDFTVAKRVRALGRKYKDDRLVALSLKMANLAARDSQKGFFDSVASAGSSIVNAGSNLVNAGMGIGQQAVHSASDWDDAIGDAATNGMGDVKNMVEQTITHGAETIKRTVDLLKDMMFKLQQEATAAAEHQAWCDREMRTNEVNKKDQEEKIAKDSARLNEVRAQKNQVIKEIEDINTYLETLLNAEQVLIDIRTKEKKLYDQTLADQTMGLEGCREASRVLSELIEGKERSEGSNTAAFGNIIDLLGVVMTDISESIALLTSDENAKIAAFQKETRAYRLEEARKNEDKKYKERILNELTQEEDQLYGDIMGYKNELALINEALRKLHLQCTVMEDSLKEKIAKGEKELIGLKEALQMLTGAIPVPQAPWR